MEWNNLADAGKISIGQNLIVSDPTTVPSPAPPAEPSAPGPDASLQDFFKNEVEERPIIGVTQPQP